ncbi:M16 family metallopeptidase [Zooshikella harenae]|uniref:Insulinase family protein n=1 Tax=Zooshikella harenae TaxID=2827238 RepID=A0ABS5ZJQ4_9GAMM|nr:pitrilysin family protein [Zooshikella harenae]MBU2713217.1 insulinase family protein [Zooshikella harenae]
MSNSFSVDKRKFWAGVIIVLPIIIALLYKTGPAPQQLAQSSQASEAASSNSEATSSELPPLNKRFNSIAELEKQSNLPSRELNIQQWQTTNGAHVYFMQADTLPMLDIRLVFAAGASRDDKLPGLAQITNGLLAEGTSNKDAAQIAAGFEQLGAQFSNGSYRDMAIASLRTLTKDNLLTPALDLFTEVIAAPSFPEDAFIRTKNQMIANLQYIKQQPGKQASQAFYQALYAKHPYGIPEHGTQTSLNTLTTDDIQDFYQKYYVANNLVIAMVGGIDQAKAKAVAEQITSKLPEGKAAPKTPTPTPIAKAQQKHIEFPSSQTHILLGTLGVSRDAKDYPALYIGNEILGGGGFGSRLMKEIREDRGLVYGVGSAFIPMQAAGPFFINLQTKQSQAKEALSLSQKILQNFIAEGPSQEELDQAKQKLLGRYPLSTASNADIVSQLGAIGFYHLPLDHMQQFLEDVQAVTRKDVQRAFAQHFQKQPLLTVTVGQQAKPDNAEKAQEKQPQHEAPLTQASQ